MATVFPQVFDDQAHVLKMTNTRIGVTKPKTLGVSTNQCRRAFDQFWRSRSGRRSFVQFIRRSHAGSLRRARRMGKTALDAHRERLSFLISPRPEDSL